MRRPQTVHPFRSFIYSFPTQQDCVLPVVKRGIVKGRFGKMWNRKAWTSKKRGTCKMKTCDTRNIKTIRLYLRSTELPNDNQICMIIPNTNSNIESHLLTH